MSRKQIRQSLFSCVPPFLNFLPPGESYEDGDEDTPQEICFPFWTATGTSPLIVECLRRSGLNLKEVRSNFGEECFSVYLHSGQPVTFES